MGKLKRNRKRIINPVGISSLREVDSEDITFNCSNLETGDMNSLLEKLQNGSSEDKECAAFTIANMARDPAFVSALIQKKIIRIVGPLIVDKNLSVRHSILGCLRNLAACGDYSVCQAMVDQDIFTSLTTLFMEYKQPWAPSKTEDGVIDSRSAIFLEACNLLWSLCESSDTAVSIFNEKRLIRILLPCLNIDVYGLQIPLVVAQCLNTVGEENTEVNEELSHPLIMEQLKAFMVLTPVESEHVLLKTLAASIMINILSGKVEQCMSDVTNPIGEVIHHTLSEPVQSALVCLSQSILSHKHERLNKYRDEKDLEIKINAVNETIKKLTCLLEAKQISLEILTNISTSSDSEEWEDTSGNGSSEDDMEMDMEDGKEIAVSPQKLELEMSSVIRDIVVRYKLFDKVIEQIVILEADDFKLISENSQARDILKRLSTVKCRALLCLNNMIQTIKVNDMGGPDRIFQLWLNIANLLFKKTDISNTEELEATTSSMRAILQKLGEAKYHGKLGDLSEFDLELLINIYHQTEQSGIKINVIRSLGTIGCLIANSELLQPCNKHVKIIGEFLLDVCSKCSDLLVVAESLDSLFDVFAEDHVDYLAREIHLLEKLKHLKKSLEPRWKQHRRSMGEESCVIKSARINLRRFIDYKTKFYRK